MPKQTSTVKISATVTAWMAQEMKRLVEGGLYANESEIIRAGLRNLLITHDHSDRFSMTTSEMSPEVDDWLRKQVVPICLAREKDSARTVSLEQAHEAIKTGFSGDGSGK